MRDGAKIYADVFRPADEKPVPPIIAWTPYGKHVPFDPKRFLNAGVKDGDTSKYTAFEAPDPTFWIPQGYAVIIIDMRGTWYSEGTAHFLAPEEAQDFYDAVEWAGTQPWSNGKVGLSGVSYLAQLQWRVAELIRRILRRSIRGKAGPTAIARSRPTAAFPIRISGRRYGTAGARARPDRRSRSGDQRTSAVRRFLEKQGGGFLQDHRAGFRRRKLDRPGPAHPRHVRGLQAHRLEGKVSVAHGQKKWAHYYVPENMRKLHAFFDHFLKGVDNDVKILAESHGRGARAERRRQNSRVENEWPLARTQYTKLYLNADRTRCRREPVPEADTVSYDSDVPELGEADRAIFDFKFDKPTELTGYMKLRVFMSCIATDDMDVFVGLHKLDKDGNVVPFAYYAQFDDGPVALGWLRASHRELDPDKSTEWQPVHPHTREQKIPPGEIVPLDIEIWPSGTMFEAGETLRLIVQGDDLNRYPTRDRAGLFPPQGLSVNKGRHVIHAGGPYESYLLVPVIPEK